MARNHIEENRRVEFYDDCDIDPATGLAKAGGTGKRVLYLASRDEQERVKARGIDAVLEILDADIPKTGQLRDTFNAQTGDALARCKGFLAAVEADVRVAATAFKNRRTR